MASWFVRTLRIPPAHLLLAKKLSGSDVLFLQRLIYAPLTGVYDEETEQRVKGFQQAHGLPVTGIVDAETAQQIERASTE